MHEIHEELVNTLKEKGKINLCLLKERLYNSMYYYVGKRYKINPVKVYFYRVRVNKDHLGKRVDYFYHTDNLWCPAKKYAKKGRCNDDNEPILYCSNHPITCVAEVKNINEGDYITLITYQAILEIQPTSFIGVDTLIENDNLLRDLLSDFYSDLKSDKYFRIIKSVDEIMTKEFREVVNDEKDNFNYNSTIAWRQLCFELSSANCLVYPSASSLLKTSNWAFNPDFAKKALLPIEAHRMRMCKNNSNIDFEIEIDAKSILNGYGEMTWNTFSPVKKFITHRRMSENPFEFGNNL